MCVLAIPGCSQAVIQCSQFLLSRLTQAGLRTALLPPAAKGSHGEESHHAKPVD